MRQLLSAGMLLLMAGNANAAIPTVERNALVAIYQSTNGPGWTDRTNWLGAPGTECSWHGVWCDESQSTVVELELQGNDLEGTLPSAALDQLINLEVLDVSTNGLTGAIPTTLGSLSKLQRLWLGENQLTGSIPSQLGNLTSLVSLRARANQLSGPLPLSLSQLHALEELHLGENQLSGALPESLSGLSSIEEIDFGSNQFTGSIPLALGGLTTLQDLRLGINHLTGTIPRGLGQLTNLRILILRENELHGTIPDELRDLTKLEQFDANQNRLTGAIPSWIGEWTALTDLFLGYNQFSGPLPPGLETLANLNYLDVAENRQLSGRLIEFTTMTKLVYLAVQFNEFSGPLPPSIGLLTDLNYATLGGNNFSGPIPVEIGALVNLTHLDLSDNEFDGPIPKEIGNLTKASDISMYSNRLSGTMPKEIGQLTELNTLAISFNAIKGPIPPEIKAMQGLDDHASDFAYNGLYTNDPTVRAFVNLKQQDGDFEETQTVMPTNVRLVETSDRSATLAWNPIRYEYYDGGYQVMASTTPNGPIVALATTSSKSVDRFTLRNLQPATTYYFTVATSSHPFWGQPNLVTSDRTAPVQGSTKQRVIAPADVDMTDAPNGMVQVDGVEVQSDSFTLTNFGDVPTAITLERTEPFFTISPEQFSLAAGASQVVTLHSLPQQPGSYFAYVTIEGQGVPEELYASIVLLASARPVGSVVATPLATRIEFSGIAGSDEVGIAQFRNSGTARLTGIVISDQPWVEVTPEPITIDPGQVREANFRIVRSKRPVSEGALTAELSLVYVSGASDARTIAALGATTSTSISISKVTIVDVTKPSVVTGSIPPLAPGEIPFFIPGLTTGATLRSDVSLINGGGPSLISDLKLYFTGSSQTKIASLQPLGFAQSVNLVNIVGSVYGATGSGALQVRSASAGGISGSAKVTAVTDEGTFSGAIPMFRGDRSAPPGERIYLAGLASGGDLIVQETGGSAGGIEISFLNATGGVLSTRNENIGAYGLVELSNAVPASAATAIVTAADAVITAYARLRDSNSDTWSVVDWSRFYGYERTSTVRVPFADGRGGNARRRAVRHDAPSIPTSDAIAPRRVTDLVLFNPTTAEVQATIHVIDTTGRVQDRTATVPAMATITVSDVASLAATSVAHVLIVPGRSELVVTARTRGPASGSAIPVVSATAGLRLGQSQVFSGLDDTSSLQTGYGFAESGGSSVTVRARIIIGGDTSSLVSTVTERIFMLNAREQVFLPELVRSFAGDLRDTAFGDLHGLVLEVNVMEGAGAIVPFVLTTDLDSTDVSLQVH